ncbi:MAG TPA: PilZ domain-containing protein [Rhizomicrobium sp.]|jgi:SAM-dependent methyltransferase
MLAYEELQGARGRETRYRPPRYDARVLFPHRPPRLRIGRSAYQIQNLSLGGLAAITKEAANEDMSVGDTVRLTIQQSGLSIFESDAKVRWAERTVFGAKVALSFVDNVIELDKLINRNLQAQIATHSSGWGTDVAALVPHEYRAFCADVLKLLRSRRAAIDANLSVPMEFARDFDHAAVFEACEAQFVQEWRAHWRVGNELVRAVIGEREKRDAVKEYTELVLTPELRGGAVWDRSYAKPLGYPGDFGIMNQVYDWQRVGGTAYQMLLHRVGLEVAECIKTRMEVVRTEIGKAVSEKEAGRTTRILSLGCGSAREVETWFARSRSGLSRAEFTLIDQEQLALDYAYRASYPYIVRSDDRHRLNCLHISFTDVLRGTGGMDALPPQDLVYSVGLIDYLTDRRAASLVRRLYEVVAPGGLLIIGNMNDAPLSNLWPMEFITDWSLYYRTDPQMLAWAEGLDPEKAWTETECTGRVRLLYVRKR